MQFLAESISGRRPHRQIMRIQSYFQRYRYFKEDRFATPAEMHAAGGGDCKSVALAKYLILLRAGVESSDLYLVYSKVLGFNRASHLDLVFGEIVLDLGARIYTIPNVPRRRPVFAWGNNTWYLVDPKWALYDSPIAPDTLIGRVCLWRLLPGWRNVVARLENEYRTGCIERFAHALAPTQFERAVLASNAYPDLSDLSDASQRELTYLLERTGGQIDVSILAKMSPRAKAEFTRFLDRNKAQITEVYRKMQVIQ